MSIAIAIQAARAEQAQRAEAAIRRLTEADTDSDEESEEDAEYRRYWSQFWSSTRSWAEAVRYWDRCAAKPGV